MFRQYYLQDDPFNKNNKRNVLNTQRHTYNCGGYALGTFSWYCPHDEADEDRGWGYDYGFNTQEEAWIKTMYSVSKMILDFEGQLRVITSLDKLNRLTERVVAFRLSADGDFHYIKKGFNGNWYHKRGGSSELQKMTQDDVLHSIWCNRYNGPVVLLAIKKKLKFRG